MDKRLIEEFPLWHSWVSRFKIPDVDRRGVPKGETYPIGGKKFEAAATLLLYPKGIQKTDEVARSVQVSGPVLRNWRSEGRFKNLVKSLEIDFANFVLKNLREPAILERIYLNVEKEPMSWSDGVLKIFIFNLAEDFEEIRGKKILAWRERIKKKLAAPQPDPDDIPRLSILDALEISPQEAKALRLKERVISNDPIYFGLAGDIFWSAFMAFHAFREDFKKQVRLTKTIEYGVSFSTIENTLQFGLLDELKKAVEANKEKDEIIRLIDQCKQSAFFLTKKLRKNRLKNFQEKPERINPKKEDSIEARPTKPARKRAQGSH